MQEAMKVWDTFCAYSLSTGNLAMTAAMRPVTERMRCYDRKVCQIGTRFARSCSTSATSDGRRGSSVFPSDLYLWGEKRGRGRGRWGGIWGGRESVIESGGGRVRRPGSAAAAVYVRVGILGAVGRHDPVDGREVEAAGSDVGGNEHGWGRA
jgi:hypothetical protein